MDQHYLIFETAGGFCGIAWNDVGVTRFQLPARSAEATERYLLRKAAGAEPGTPTPLVLEAVAAAKRYFDGEKVDFSDVRLDLDGQDGFFRQIYDAARGSVGAIRRRMARWRRNLGLVLKRRVMSGRLWPIIRCR